MIDRTEVIELRNTAKVRVFRLCQLAQTTDTNYNLNKAEALQEFFQITDEELDELSSKQEERE